MGQITREEHRALAGIVVEMPKAQMVLKLAKDMKGNRRGFYRYTGNRREAEERRLWACSSMGQVTKHMKKAEVHSHRLCKKVGGTGRAKGRPYTCNQWQKNHSYYDKVQFFSSFYTLILFLSHAFIY